MIGNARMYTVNTEAGELWRRLLQMLCAAAGAEVAIIDYPAPAPLQDLWRREDMAAVFMCGLPFARALPRLEAIAAPLPAPPEFGGLAQYWSAMVVRADGDLQSLEDTFGGRIALTDSDSQSGFAAPLQLLRQRACSFPLYAELIEPCITPLGAVTAVLDGAADVAPVDAYALALLGRFRPELTTRLRTVACTQPTPIPLLVASTPGLTALRTAFLHAAGDARARPLLDELLLHGFAAPALASYESLSRSFEESCRYWRTHRLAKVMHPAFL